MYERIKRLFKEERLDDKGVWNAVGKGLITEEQYSSITGRKYNTPYVAPKEPQPYETIEEINERLEPDQEEENE